jgi:hypothetical protein
MPEEKNVSADVINDLTEQIMNRLEKVRKEIMYEKDDLDEFSHRIVAMYGALILMLEKHMHYMAKNGYTKEALENLEKTFRDSFALIDEPTNKPKLN